VENVSANVLAHARNGAIYELKYLWVGRFEEDKKKKKKKNIRTHVDPKELKERLVSKIEFSTRNVDFMKRLSAVNTQTLTRIEQELAKKHNNSL
jgi:hypothetical protein